MYQHEPNPQIDITLYKKLLIPPPGSSSTSSVELTKISSITYDITWLHRTYKVAFPDQKDTPISYLRNFLAVPLQFGVVAVEYANYTVEDIVINLAFGGVGFPLPEALRTTAVGGRSTTRLVIQEWTGWTFIGGAIGMLAVSAAGIVWVLSRDVVRVMGSSGIPELDILRVGGWNRSSDGDVEDGDRVVWESDRGEHGHDIGDDDVFERRLERRPTGLMALPGGGVGLSRENTSSWKLAVALRNWGVVSVKGNTGEDTTFVAVQRVKKRKAKRGELGETRDGR